MLHLDLRIMNLVALRSPDFRLYYTGAVAVVNGMWIIRIVIAWMAWEISGSATYVGIIAATSLLPTIVSGPFFGVYVDRANIKKAAYSTNLSMSACLILLLVLHSTGKINQATLIGITLVMGLITSAHHPVRLSLGPRLVQARHVGSVVALAALNFNLARLLSPAIGGLLIDRLGISTAIMITLVLFLPNLLILYRLKPREMDNGTAREGFAQAFISGLRYMWHRPAVRLALLATAVFSITIRGVLEVLPIVADGVFEKGAVGLGQLGSAVGAGALCAALLKALGKVDTRSGRSILSARNVTAGTIGIFALALLGSTGRWDLALLSSALLGFCGTFLGVGMQSLIQADLPDELRGRVMSIWIVVGLGGTALGAFAIGAMAEISGLSAASLATSTLGLIAISLIAVRNRVKSVSKSAGP